MLEVQWLRKRQAREYHKRMILAFDLEESSSLLVIESNLND